MSFHTVTDTIEVKSHTQITGTDEGFVITPTAKRRKGISFTHCWMDEMTEWQGFMILPSRPKRQLLHNGKKP